MRKYRDTLAILCLVLLAVVSIFPLANWAMNPERYEKVVASLDHNAQTVLRLTAASTAASAGISMIPDDTATPIAEKLADFTEYFLLILCVLYAEKYMLTLVGALAFWVLVPAGCLILAAGILWRPDILHRLGFKLLLVAMAAMLAVPVSVWASDSIYATYSQNLETAIVSAEDFSEETGQLSQANGDREKAFSILQRLSESVSSLTRKASAIVNNYLELLAVMIVTSCVIPLLVLLFFLWVIKILTGIQVPVPFPRHAHRQERETVQ